MDEQEKARRLGKAIDDLLRGQEPELDNQELCELLDIARLRRAAARAAGGLAENYRDFVWARVEARLMQILERRGPKPNNAPSSQGRTAEREERAFGRLRRMADAGGVAEKAEAQRDALWKEVEAAIKARQQWRNWRSLPFSQFSRKREQQEAEELEQVLNRLILGEPIWEAEDSRLKGLIEVARVRHALGRALAASAAPHEKRVWDNLTTEARGQARPRYHGLPWPRLAAAAAAVAIAIFALGPLPATGLAGHPVTRLVDFVRDRVGVSEVETPPQIPPPTETLPGIDVTVAQAQQLMRLPVREPAYLPPGFHQVASRYFPQAITAATGGLWELAYSDGEASSLVIWQEPASTNTVAVQRGSAWPLALEQGVEGTYYEGMWHVEGTEAVWGAAGAQTILFDRGPVRIIILYLGAEELALPELQAIANSLLGEEPAAP